MSCNVCKSPDVETVLNFDSQPVSNRFCNSTFEQEFKHHLELGQCVVCGLVQLIDPFPKEQLIPKYDWIKYNEPESHLDSVAETIYPLLPENAKICGISYKDDTLLERFRQKGFTNVRRLNPKDDFMLKQKQEGVETIQAIFDENKAEDITLKYGTFDLVIVRHLLEHAYDFTKFVKAAKKLIKPGGLIFFEVPDCNKQFQSLDYSVIWEEHLLYFTPTTFKNSLLSTGLELVRFDVYPFPMENCLVAITKNTEQMKTIHIPSSALNKERILIHNFGAQFKHVKQQVQKFFANSQKKGKIAIFGAGHTACILINIFDISSYISFVVDDNASKVGLFMPSSKIPIRDSSVLQEVSLSIFSLNPQIEEKIVQSKHAFRQQGGEFLSFSPASNYFIFDHIDNQESKTNSITKFNKISEEVYYANNPIVELTNKDIITLVDKASMTKRQRSRICTHLSEDSEVHEMLIVHKKNTYVRPHKHIGKQESFHVLEGTADVVIFDEEGNIEKVVEMGDYNSNRRFYFRLNKSKFHTLLITSELFIFHETTSGPFDRSKTIFAPWSPTDQDPVKAKDYIYELQSKIITMLDREKLDLTKEFYYHRNNCRMCGSNNFTNFISIPATPIGDAYLSNEDIAKEIPVFPLDLFVCNDCTLLQLLDVANPDIVYREYIYKTSDSLGLVDHFRHYVKDILNKTNIAQESFVVDIGSNDGSFLKHFKNEGMKVLGVDPARDIAAQATNLGITTIPELFTPSLALDICKNHGRAKIITANNVFANIDDLETVTQAVRLLLAEDGVFIVESGYGLDLIRKKVLDNVYHEHLSYISVKPMQRFFAKQNMELIDVSYVNTKAGSVRYIAQKRNGQRSVSPSVDKMIRQEDAYNLQDITVLKELGNKWDNIKQQLWILIDKYKIIGKKIVGYGASVGVTTLLFYFGFDKSILECLVDDNERRHNLYSPNLHIPVRSPSMLYDAKNKPDYVIVLAWQYNDPILAKHQQYLDNGGHIILIQPYAENGKEIVVL